MGPRPLSDLGARPLNFTVRRIALVPSGALATTLRATFGALAGAMFALFVVAVPYDSFAIPTIFVVTCVGAGIGAYLALRYGDRFIIWVLKFWNRPGE